MKNTCLLLSFLVVGSPHFCSAQWASDSVSESHIHRGITFVYNLSFDSARSEFQQVTHAAPEHPAGHFFLAMVEWWRIITDINNTSHDDKFLSLLDRVIDLCDKRLDEDENDVTALFFKGGALGFQGRLYGNREDWLKAANCGREALPLVQKAYKLAPRNEDILMGIGIYNYYAAVIPDQFPFVKPFMIFFPKGNKQKGLEQLRSASRQASYANIEATYFLMQVLQNFEKQYPEALQLSLSLNKRFPNNVIFHKYVGRCNAALGNWAEMREVFLEVLQRAQRKQLGYDAAAEREANYYLGLNEMTSQKHDLALQYFYRADALSRTIDGSERSGFMVMTNLRIGMIYDVQGKRDLAITQYRKVLDMKDYQDSHRQAEQYLKTPYTRS